MTCFLLEIDTGWWSSSGLALDLIGVSLLGYDLIRVQRKMRNEAKQSLSEYERLIQENGGFDEYIAEIKRNSRWVSSHEYSDYHAEDEVSFNARQSQQQMQELADCSDSLADHVSEIVKIYRDQTERDKKLSDVSIKYSVLGIVFIVIGFAFQLVANIPTIEKACLP